LLQQLTVDLMAVFNLYKEAHWDLSGPLYLQLHEYYDQQADFYRKQADEFAERVLHLGYSVDGRYSTIARTTTIPDFPAGYLTDNESLRLLVERVTVLQKEIYKGIQETEQSDPPTSNRLQDMAYAVDKNLWQLRIHLQEPGGQGANLPWASPRGHARAKK
jgi:starvation-inducible DNA-binding protein